MCLLVVIDSTAYIMYDDYRNELTIGNMLRRGPRIKLQNGTNVDIYERDVRVAELNRQTAVELARVFLVAEIEFQ